MDHTRKIFYFESALSPIVVAVDLNKIDFAPGTGIRRIALEGKEGYDLQGVINDRLKPAKPITYLAP